MKFKKQSIIFATGFLALAALAGISFMNGFGFNLASRQGSGEDPVFEINSHSTFTEIAPGEYGGRANVNGNINSVGIVFNGFSMENNNLYVPKGGNAYFRNTDPIRGISEIDFIFNSKGTENVDLSTITFFSYNQISYDNLGAGKYIDLFYMSTTRGGIKTANWVYESTTESKMLGARYFLTLIYVEPTSDDLALGSVSITTPCTDEPAYKEVGQVSDWTNEEKETMTDAIGVVLPFVNFSAYDFDDSEPSIETIFFDTASFTAYKAAVAALGFEKTYETEMGGGVAEIYQKEVASAVYSVEFVAMHYGEVVSANIMMTDTLDRLYIYDSWPTQFISDKLGSSYASDVPIFDDSSFTGIEYTCAAQSGRKDVMIVFGNKDKTPISSAVCQAVKDYFLNLISSYSFIKTSDSSFGDDYYSAAAENLDLGLHIGVQIYPSMNVAQIEIMVLDKLDEFPLTKLNTITGVNFPMYDGNNAQFFVVTQEEAARKRINVNVYYADIDDMTLYAEALANNGFNITSSGEGYVYLNSNPFDAISVDLRIKEYGNQTYLSISASRQSYVSGIVTLDSFDDAIEWYYVNQETNAEALLDGYVFPSTEGATGFIFDYYGDYSNGDRALHIAGLGQAFVDALINGKDYYLPEKGYILNSNENYTLIVKPRVYAYGVVIGFKLLYNSEMLDVVSMTKANSDLVTWYEGLEDSAQYMGSPIDTADFSDVNSIIPQFIDSDAGYVFEYCGSTSFNIRIFPEDKEQFINDYTSVISALGAYQYSELQGVYYDPAHYVYIFIQNDDYYDYLTISYNLQEYDFRDYVDKDHIDLSDLDKWPLIDSGNAKIYNELDDYSNTYAGNYDYRLTIKQSYDLTAYKASLVSAGYSLKHISNYGDEYDVYYKIDENHRYLEIRINYDYYSYPLNQIEIRYIAEYGDAFALFNTVKGQLENSSIGSYLPNAGANDYARIDTDNNGYCSFQLEPGFDKASYKQTLQTAGFTQSSDENTLYKQDGNNLINVKFVLNANEVIEEMQVTVIETHWDAYPDKDMHISLFSALADYIPAMSTNSNDKYFELVNESKYEYTLRVKKEFDLDAYFEEFKKDQHVSYYSFSGTKYYSYTVEVGNNSYSFQTTVYDRGSYYEVDVSCYYSYFSNEHELSLQKIDNLVFGGDGVFAAIGDFSFLIKDHYVEYSEDTYININNCEASELNAFIDLMEANTNFELDAGSSSSNYYRYTYVTNGMMYEVIINTKSNVVTLEKMFL